MMPAAKRNRGLVSAALHASKATKVQVIPLRANVANAAQPARDAAYGEQVVESQLICEGYRSA